MRLVAFRVQNYKKIQDTGWITVRDLTVFVGKNEAGKSALFRGLSKLNPSDGERYDGLKEFPRRHYTSKFKSQDWPVASAKFELSESEKNELASIARELRKVTHITYTRYYSWKLDIDFEPELTVKLLSNSEFLEKIEDIEKVIRDLAAPEGRGEFLSQVKTHLLAMISSIKDLCQTDQSGGEVLISETENLLNEIAIHASEDWQINLLAPVRSGVEQLSMRARTSNQIRKWAEKHLPKFVYFDRYDIIDSAVHLPTFISQLNSNPTSPRVRATRCLFEHVGLDVNRLAELGRQYYGSEQSEEVRRYIDERAIHLSSASNAMTQKFQDWWEQRRHKFRYQADGDYFRIWVSDDLDPSEIELDQRSLGMQYFFSFYTVFLVEAQDQHQKAILLLDEPGLHMHGTAQAKVVKFLEKLAQQNQTLYTTHSPFMVDANHLERVRIVYEDNDGTTKVSENVWPRDRDALFPLQAGLGYQLVQSLFISKRQLIVEGITDYWILKALDLALKQRERKGLRDDVVIVPSGGVNNLLPLVSMLIGHDVQVVALLDGDEPGRREGKKLTEKLFAGNVGQCLFIGDFVENNEAELEDIFGEETYLESVKKAFGLEDLRFEKEEESVSGITNKVSALFNRKGYARFEKWKPAGVLRDWLLNEPHRIPDKVYNIAERIFEAINKAFEPNADVNGKQTYDG
mgnify:CR=1 FL=1